jgi:hypothetical protein
MNRGEPLPLMSHAERESYCSWLRRLAGKKRGTLPDHLRNAAAQLSGLWGNT